MQNSEPYLLHAEHNSMTGFVVTLISFVFTKGAHVGANVGSIAGVTFFACLFPI
jgi:hypothetical protein